MRKYIVMVIVLFVLGGIANALEIVRQKNVATQIMFPLIATDGTMKTGAAALDSEYSYWADGAGPVSFADLAAEAVEVISAGGGFYALSIAQGEMNHDYIAVQVTATATLTQNILIRTLVGDPLNLATNSDGNAYSVSSAGSGEIASAEKASIGTIASNVADVLTDTGTTIPDWLTADANARNLTMVADKVVIDTIAVDVAGLDGDAMRGTDGANTTVPDVAGTAATLHGITDGKVDSIQSDTTQILAEAEADRLTTTATDAAIALIQTDTTQLLSEANADRLTTTDIIAKADAITATQTTIIAAVTAVQASADASAATQTTIIGYVDGVETDTAALIATASALNATVVTLNAKSDAITNTQTTIIAAIAAAVATQLTESNNIGINWADIANPTTVVDLSGTTVGVVTAVSDKGDYSVSAASVTNIVNKIWDEDVDSTHQTAGTAGKIIGTTLTEAATANGTALTNLTAGAEAEALTVNAIKLKVDRIRP